MKYLSSAFLCLLILASCKKNESENAAPAEVQFTNRDTVVKNNIQTDAKLTDAGETNPTEKNDEAEVESEKNEGSYASFGAKIKPEKALSKEQMLSKYKALKKGDTIKVKFSSTIKAVCKKKGCWMEMELPNKQVSFVRFKDYGFFVPLNADRSEAIVSGRAYIDVVSVDERKHYAKDEGKSEEEIAKITEPKITYAFQADGVLIKE